MKVEIGGARGQRLVESSELGLSQTLAYRPFARVPVSLGGFVRFDVGSRRAGRFAGFDGEGRAVIADATGGPYYELWLGPFLRAEWRFLFVDLGYGAYALRHDEGRADLPNASGSAKEALRTSPAVAFRLGAGAEIALSDAFAATLLLEYRVRYYDRRGGEELAKNVVHGTQNFTPFFGLSYRFGVPPAEAASLP